MGISIGFVWKQVGLPDFFWGAGRSLESVGFDGGRVEAGWLLRFNVQHKGCVLRSGVLSKWVCSWRGGSV